MAVGKHGGTMPEAVTPICNDCNIFLCWDIGEDEYQQDKAFWDAWKCEHCNGSPMSRKSFYAEAA